MVNAEGVHCFKRLQSSQIPSHGAGAVEVLLLSTQIIKKTAATDRGEE